MSKQIITIKKKSPSDATRSSRRRTQKRRAQAAQQQRWQDANAMVKAVLSNILNHEEDAYIRQEFKQICDRVDKRVKGKQTDEQIVLKAIKNGCWTLEDIQDETGFTIKFIKDILNELLKLNKIIYQNDYYRAV